MATTQPKQWISLSNGKKQIPNSNIHYNFVAMEVQRERGKNGNE